MKLSIILKLLRSGKMRKNKLKLVSKVLNQLERKLMNLQQIIELKLKNLQTNMTIEIKQKESISYYTKEKMVIYLFFELGLIFC